MLKGVISESIISETEGRDDYKKRMREEKLNTWNDSALHGQFIRQTKEIADPQSWTWVKNGFLKRETEGMIFAAQEQALRTNVIKSAIDKQNVSPKCRLCGMFDETGMHIVSGCPKLAQKEYRRRHDKVASRVHWELCKKYGLECTERWYEHKPSAVMECEEVTLYWDLTIQTDRTVEHNRPDIVLIEKKEHRWIIIDIAIPSDFNISKTETWKVEKYQDLAFEIRRIHQVETKLVPVVLGALGTVSKQLKKSIEILSIPDIIASAQMSTILGTANILRKVLCL